MKRKEFIAEYSEKTVDELKEALKSKAEELLKLRVRHASRQLDTPHRISEEKRNYARLCTMLKVKQEKSSSNEAN